MRERQRVAVVGCGMAGAMAAALLARDGHEVTVLERAPAVGPVGAGLLLQPSGQEVLRRAGLLPEVTHDAEPIAEMRAVTWRGRQLVRLIYGELYEGCCAYGVHRADLFGVLHRAALAAGVQVKLGCEVAECEHGNGHVRLRDLTGGVHGPFDFVVAADGGRSAMRQAAGAQCRVKQYAHGAMWLIGRSSAVRGRLYQVTRGTGILCGVLPTGGGRASLFWGLPARDFETIRTRGFAPWRDAVVATCPEAAELLQDCGSFDRVAFTTYQHVSMPRWDAGRVLFVGDAGHATSPHLGQGVNLALVDAQTLARAVASEPDWLGVVRAYHVARLRQQRFYSDLTYCLSPFFQSNGAARGWGRDAALPVMQHLPWLRRQMLSTLAGVKRGWLADLAR